MRRKSLCILLTLCLVGAGGGLRAQSPPSDPDVAKGIKQVEDGEYDGAILTLDSAARRLSADPSKARDLSQAYLYLGIAYVGKGHEAAARAKFREALGQMKDLSLSPEKFPPKVIDLFEAAKEEAAKNPPAGKGAAQAKKKGGGGKFLLIGLGVAAAAGGVAVAAGGGGSNAPQDTRKTETFTGSLCCNDYPSNFRQVDIVVGAAGTLDATITWTSADTNIYFGLELQDDTYTTVATSSRTTNTTAQLTASVSPRTSSPGAAYHMNIGLNNDGTTTPVDFTLTVRHP